MRPLAIELLPAGAFRRTQAERDSSRLSWERPDRNFFAAGACHVLAWVCRGAYPERGIWIEAVRRVGVRQVFHTYATVSGWTFDHSGWHRSPALVAAEEEAAGEALERVRIESDLDAFCAEHFHRVPADYWRDPIPRAQAYVERFMPPWDAPAVPSEPREQHRL